ncbi:MAG: hypothetical protein CMG74_08230 [Candidatus Marinimicrobia bacterium]|nr:hypothetical protein [Candidatus Neomarinimicrobiota bacterium]|tara:strand:+ start:981 stop:2642 length:1662 start_codon:yes stop_codon:yes gene_type:complete
MAYKVLSLKWRPQSFQEVVGQSHITQTLVNAFDQNRIAQGYLFTGPRGVGKTTMARILAMAINSKGGATAKFDKNSKISREIANGRALDVIEIDGASNRGIDEIRNLREQIKFAPMHCNYKIIIIDEVHMLTVQAFNSLLRTLEEPPDHGKFIFCTTDIHKVPTTIISRCQRFDFNRISLKNIVDHLEVILKEEGKNYDKESLVLIARKADGSMRDGLSLLDQVIAYSGDDIKYEYTVKALGFISDIIYFELTNCIRKKDDIGMVNLLSKISSFGVPASEILQGFSLHIRNIIYADIGIEESLLEMNEEYQEKYKDESKKWDRMDLLRIGQLISNVSSVIKYSDNGYLLLEMTALKLLEFDKTVLIEDLLSKNSLERENNSNSFELTSSKNKKKVNESKKKIDESVGISTKIVSNDSEKKSIKDDEKKSKNEVSIETIIKNWSRIVEKTHIAKPSVAAVLEGCKPIEVSKNIILIQSFGKSGFNLKTIEKGIEIIEKIISEILYEKFKIEFIQDDNLNLEQKNEQDKSKLDSLSVDENTLNRIVEVFDGEILH